MICSKRFLLFGVFVVVCFFRVFFVVCLFGYFFYFALQDFQTPHFPQVHAEPECKSILLPGSGKRGGSEGLRSILFPLDSSPNGLLRSYSKLFTSETSFHCNSISQVLHNFIEGKKK